jgi:hypothetical protein
VSNMGPEMGIERHLSFKATFVAFVARRGAFVANVSLAILAHGRFCVQGRSLSETWKAETMPNAVSNEFKHSLLNFTFVFIAEVHFAGRSLEGVRLRRASCPVRNVAQKDH